VRQTKLASSLWSTFGRTIKYSSRTLLYLVTYFRQANVASVQASRKPSSVRWTSIDTVWHQNTTGM